MMDNTLPDANTVNLEIEMEENTKMAFLETFLKRPKVEMGIEESVKLVRETRGKEKGFIH